MYTTSLHSYWWDVRALIILSFLFSDTCFYNNININSTQFLISTIYNVSSAFECQTKCWDSTLNCQFFTFYIANITEDNMCYLRSRASGNKVISNNYVSGPFDCNRNVGGHIFIVQSIYLRSQFYWHYHALFSSLNVYNTIPSFSALCVFSCVFYKIIFP